MENGLPFSTLHPRPYIYIYLYFHRRSTTLVVVFFFVSFFIFTEGEKEEKLLPVFEAMNLHYHTALQAVH